MAGNHLLLHYGTAVHILDHSARRIAKIGCGPDYLLKFSFQVLFLSKNSFLALAKIAFGCYKEKKHLFHDAFQKKEETHPKRQTGIGCLLTVVEHA